MPPALLRGCGAWSSNGDKRPEGALGPQGLHGLPGLSPPGGRVARPVLRVAARSLGSGVLALSGPRSSSPSEGHTASSQVPARRPQRQDCKSVTASTGPPVPAASVLTRTNPVTPFAIFGRFVFE